MAPPGTRYPLQPAKRCAYGVSAATEESVQPCGEIAVAVWFWGTGTGLPVCEEHDYDIANSAAEKPDCDTNTD